MGVISLWGLQSSSHHQKQGQAGSVFTLLT